MLHAGVRHSSPRRKGGCHANPTQYFRRQEENLPGGTLGTLLLLAALPAVAESGQSGYPITIDIRATAKGDQAMPFNFAVQPNREVVLLIRNYTRELHTFAIPAIGLNVAVLPGSPRAPRTTRVSFVLPARFAVYRWFCVPCKLGLHHRHHMSGKSTRGSTQTSTSDAERAWRAPASRRPPAVRSTTRGQRSAGERNQPCAARFGRFRATPERSAAAPTAAPTAGATSRLKTLGTT